MVVRTVASSQAGVRRIALFLATTVVVVVLLFSYRTSRGPGDTGTTAAAVGNQPGIVSQPGNAAGGGGGSGSGTGSGSSSGPGPSSTGSTSGSGSSGDTVVNGTVASTRWGPVQVRVTISSGKITDAAAIQYPSGNGRDQQINAFALPRLRSEVLAAQSADIDVVSGATVTSDGYIESLQAALDMAHFG